MIKNEELAELLLRIVGWGVPIMFAIIVHEVAHGWAAKKLGDNTAASLGRLSLNPFKHIDLVGTIIVPGILLLSFTGILFGWAKPVPIEPSYFKNPRRDMAIVALAGPLSNILMAVFWALIMRLGVMLYTGDEDILPFILMYLGKTGIFANLVLALLNLIPIPPLDGSRIVSGLLPLDLAYQYNRLERYGLMILLLLMLTGGLNILLDQPLFWVQQAFFSLGGM